MKKWLGIAIAGVLLVWVFHQDKVELGEGVLAPVEPKQTQIENPVPLKFEGYTVKPLADFHITAKVILREDYSMGREADVSPMDLALGWGRMSDEAILKHINFSQSGRWYRYRYQSAPIPQKEIETHSANMHMIPAEPWIEDDLADIVPGQIIELKGKLVEVTDKDGWRWRSSLRRDDTGSGACELVYVESIKIVRDG
ncbi:hypothetical protein [Kangiella shandongensis]|uniref:hypothetical protein n=1 Tax=Kangiella shandongensis TaxID=2763258 RepID=UPI001CC08C4B|nr:hypothetical protein [Kangiella shandongensis]